MEVIICIYCAGTILSILCVMALLTLWCLLPPWRSLQTYITLNQIVIGTAYLCYTTSAYFVYEIDIGSVIIITMSGTIFISSSCWSVCASLVAYFKLVFIYNRKISYEKRKVTVFAWGMVGVITGVCKFIPTYFLELDEDKNFICETLLAFIPLLLLQTINLAVFLRVCVSVMSCCTDTNFKRSGWHVVSLICVGLVCDSMSIVYIFIIFKGFLSDGDDISAYGISLFAFRLVPQSVLLLFNKKSQALWKQYLRRRRLRRM